MKKIAIIVMASILLLTGMSLFIFNDVDAAHTAALRLAQTLNNKFLTMLITNSLGLAARGQGDYAKAMTISLQELELGRELGLNDATPHLNLGLVALRLNDAQAARSYAQEALKISRKADDLIAILTVVTILAGLHILAEQIERGLALLGFVGSHPATDEDMRLDMKEILALLPDTLSQEEIRAGMDKGKDLNMDEILKELQAD